MSRVVDQILGIACLSAVQQVTTLKRRTQQMQNNILFSARFQPKVMLMAHSSQLSFPIIMSPSGYALSKVGNKGLFPCILNLVIEFKGSNRGIIFAAEICIWKSCSRPNLCRPWDELFVKRHCSQHAVICPRSMALTKSFNGKHISTIACSKLGSSTKKLPKVWCCNWPFGFEFKYIHGRIHFGTLRSCGKNRAIWTKNQALSLPGFLQYYWLKGK